MARICDVAGLAPNTVIWIVIDKTWKRNLFAVRLNFSSTFFNKDNLKLDKINPLSHDQDPMLSSGANCDDLESCGSVFICYKKIGWKLKQKNYMLLLFFRMWCSYLMWVQQSAIYLFIYLSIYILLLIANQARWPRKFDESINERPKFST